jgi:integrase
MYSLTWGMIDFKDRMLNIPTSKNGEPLHLPLNVAALAALKAVYKEGEQTDRVFQSAKTKNSLGNSGHWFEKALVKAKIVNFHWHDLRHHFASKLRRAGAKLEEAKLLGHKGLAMTKRCSHLGPNQSHEVAALLDLTNSTSVAREPEPETTVSIRYLN